MTTRFDDIVAELSVSDFHIVRGYILDTVRAEFGPLIQYLQGQAEPKHSEEYSAGTGEPVNHEPFGFGPPEEDEPEEDQPEEVGATLGDLLKTFGIGKHDSHDDQHLRFHALQMALAFCHESTKDPMVHANLFYGFLKGDAD